MWNLRILLNLQLLFSDQVSDKARWVFVKTSSDTSAVPFSGSGGSAYSDSHLSHLLGGLLQCTVRGASFEKHLEAIAAAKCSNAGSYECIFRCTCYSSYQWAALVGDVLPDAIQDADVQLESCSWHRTRLLVPICFYPSYYIQQKRHSVGPISQRMSSRSRFFGCYHCLMEYSSFWD